MRMPGRELKNMTGWWRSIRCSAVTMAAAAVLVTVAQPAAADPLPGFEFDPVALEQRMDACLSYESPPNAILMGWVNLRTAQQRIWRCSSLRHMMRHDDPDREVHDPYVDIPNFMRCADEVISYGFPRKSRAPGNIALIKQYNGTSSQAIVAINELTGDIATIYTEPAADDWAGCIRPI